jgi:uncharacterized protein YqjF (DUF2071 family)
MIWQDLVFLHWPISPEALGPHVPARLPIDTWDGTAWLSVVAFRMRRFRPLRLPLPGDRISFAQLNVRTYTTLDGRPGIYLLDVSVSDRLIATSTRLGLRLPYRHADMHVDTDGDGVRLASVRAGPVPTEFRASWRPTGPARAPQPGGLDAFLVNRLSLYSIDWFGGVLRTDVSHGPWPLQPASVAIEANSLGSALRLRVPDGEPRVGFSRRLDVLGLAPLRVRRG